MICENSITKAKCFQVELLSRSGRVVQSIPNGYLDAYEVKVNIDIFKYHEKVKLISQFQRFFFIFQWLIRVFFTPIE